MFEEIGKNLTKIVKIFPENYKKILKKFLENFEEFL